MIILFQSGKALAFDRGILRGILIQDETIVDVSLHFNNEFVCGELNGISGQVNADRLQLAVSAYLGGCLPSKRHLVPGESWAKTQQYSLDN